MKKLFVSIIFILFLLNLKSAYSDYNKLDPDFLSNRQFTLHQPQNEIEERVNWVVDDVIFSGKFPVIIKPSNETIEISTSWGAWYNYSAYEEYNQTVKWIETPSETGLGNITVYFNGIKHKTYNLEWDKLARKNLSIDSISYSHRYFSYWVGTGLFDFVVNSSSFHKIQNEYNVRNPEFGQLGPFESEFIIEGSGFPWTSFKTLIENYTLEQFQTWQYNKLAAICDGGGYVKLLSMTSGNYSINLNLIEDNDSCVGTSTLFSDKAILNLFNELEEFMSDYIKDNSTTSGISSPTTMLIALIIAIKLVKKFKNISSSHSK